MYRNGEFLTGTVSIINTESVLENLLVDSIKKYYYIKNIYKFYNFSPIINTVQES